MTPFTLLLSVFSGLFLLCKEFEGEGIYFLKHLHLRLSLSVLSRSHPGTPAAPEFFSMRGYKQMLDDMAVTSLRSIKDLQFGSSNVSTKMSPHECPFNAIYSALPLYFFPEAELL